MRFLIPDPPDDDTQPIYNPVTGDNESLAGDWLDIPHPADDIEPLYNPITSGDTEPIYINDDD